MATCEKRKREIEEGPSDSDSSEDENKLERCTTDGVNMVQELVEESVKDQLGVAFARIRRKLKYPKKKKKGETKKRCMFIWQVGYMSKKQCPEDAVVGREHCETHHKSVESAERVKKARDNLAATNALKKAQQILKPAATATLDTTIPILGTSTTTMGTSTTTVDTSASILDTSTSILDTSTSNVGANTTDANTTSVGANTTNEDATTTVGTSTSSLGTSSTTVGTSTSILGANTTNMDTVPSVGTSTSILGANTTNADATTTVGTSTSILGATTTNMDTVPSVDMEATMILGATTSNVDTVTTTNMDMDSVPIFGAIISTSADTKTDIIKVEPRRKIPKFVVNLVDEDFPSPPKTAIKLERIRKSEDEKLIEKMGKLGKRPQIVESTPMTTSVFTSVTMEETIDVVTITPNAELPANVRLIEDIWDQQTKRGYSRPTQPKWWNLGWLFGKSK